MTLCPCSELCFVKNIDHMDLAYAPLLKCVYFNQPNVDRIVDTACCKH